MMKSLAFGTAVLSLLSTTVEAAKSNISQPLASRLILPTNFKPPQVFKNVNLLHSINLEKGYAREAIVGVIENISKEPQDEYFLPFSAEVMGKIGVLEVRDKKDTDTGNFVTEVVEYDVSRFVWRIHGAGWLS